MEARIILLADFANVDAAGKLNIIGAFNRLHVSRFPAKHPLMSLVLRLLVELGEFDQQRSLKIILYDEDGNERWKSPDIAFMVGKPAIGHSEEINPIITLQNTEFEKGGRYEYRIYINGD